MDEERLYQAHLDELFGIVPVDKWTEEDVDRTIQRMLAFLPNNGKLYKYRSIEGETFDNAFDGLEKGYIYMARANTLNDDLDSSLNYDVEKDVKKQAELFFSKPWFYLESWVNANMDQLGMKVSPVDLSAYKTVLSCVDQTTYEIDREKAIQSLMTYCGVGKAQAVSFIENCLLMVDDQIKKHEQELQKSFSSFVNYNELAKKDIYVFSMTEDNNSETMWAYYANSNKGFCIEYDYRKIPLLSFEQKKMLINTFRVNYEEQLKEYSFIDMFRYFMGGQKDQALFKKANREILENTIAKLSKWKEEKEWRIFLCNLDDNNKVYADIVSGIIIDERVLNHVNAKRLIELCKKRNWKIRIRRKDPPGISHHIEELII